MHRSIWTNVCKTDAVCNQALRWGLTWGGEGVYSLSYEWQIPCMTQISSFISFHVHQHILCEQQRKSQVKVMPCTTMDDSNVILLIFFFFQASFHFMYANTFSVSSNQVSKVKVMPCTTRMIVANVRIRFYWSFFWWRLLKSSICSRPPSTSVSPTPTLPSFWAWTDSAPRPPTQLSTKERKEL